MSETWSTGGGASTTRHEVLPRETAPGENVDVSVSPLARPLPPAHSSREGLHRWGGNQQPLRGQRCCRLGRNADWTPALSVLWGDDAQEEKETDWGLAFSCLWPDNALEDEERDWAPALSLLWPDDAGEDEETDWGLAFSYLWPETASVALSTSAVGSTPCSATPPTLDQPGNPTSATMGVHTPAALPAGLAQAQWKIIMAPILPLTKVDSGGDTEEEEEADPDCGKLEHRHKARYIEAADAAAAAAPTRPRGANQWSQVDALTEGFSLWQLSDMPSPSHFMQHESSQAYI